MLLGQFFEGKRKEKGLSVYNLGYAVGVHPQTITRLERTGSCSLKLAVKIANALGIESIPVKLN